jgi:hypothetical protein
MTIFPGTSASRPTPVPQEKMVTLPPMFQKFLRGLFVHLSSLYPQSVTSSRILTPTPQDSAKLPRKTPAF